MAVFPVHTYYFRARTEGWRKCWEVAWQTVGLVELRVACRDSTVIVVLGWGVPPPFPGARLVGLGVWCLS